MSRNESYPPAPLWDSCEHEWLDVDNEWEADAVKCKNCGCPGERNHDGSVYWPAT